MRIKAESRASERPVREARGVASTGDDSHAEWVRDSPRRIRAAQQEGMRMAEDSDVSAGHDGYKDENGVIRNGDLVLMIGSRAKKEMEAQKRLQADHEREQRINAAYDQEGRLVADPEQHYKSRGGRAIPLS